MQEQRHSLLTHVPSGNGAILRSPMRMLRLSAWPAISLASARARYFRTVSRSLNRIVILDGMLHCSSHSGQWALAPDRHKDGSACREPNGGLLYVQAATSSTLDPMTQSCWRSQMPPWWRNCSAVKSLESSCTTFTQATTTRRSGISHLAWHCLA